MCGAFVYSCVYLKNFFVFDKLREKLYYEITYYRVLHLKKSLRIMSQPTEFGSSQHKVFTFCPDPHGSPH